jgi:hypothetical protein
MYGTNIHTFAGYGYLYLKVCWIVFIVVQIPCVKCTTKRLDSHCAVLDDDWTRLNDDCTRLGDDCARATSHLTIRRV